MKYKPKQWTLVDQDEKYRLWHFEAGEGSDSRLWIDLRQSVASGLYVTIRSNGLDGGKNWIRFAWPIKNHAVAKRSAFALIAYRTVPIS
jgi:hypothetical protein